MILELLLYVITLLVIYQLYVYTKLLYHYIKYDVKFKLGVPIFGNTLYSTMAMQHVIEDIDDVYRAFPDERYLGYMEGHIKVLLIKDPELIKLITVKDFDHFVNRKEFFPKEIDSVLGASVLQMKGKDWRQMRSRLTPAFVTSKMKLMIPCMVEGSYNVVNYIKEHQGEDLYVTDLMHRYNTDVLASTIFGIQVNSVKDRDNVFYQIGVSAVELTFGRKIFYFIALHFPFFAKVLKSLGIELIPGKGTDFIKKVVCETIEYRKRNNVVRPDFMHLLVKSSKGNLKPEGYVKEKYDFSTVAPEEMREWTSNEIAGQVYFAFLASFESSSSALTLCFHEMALNADIQEKLYQEIKAHHDKEGELAYDGIGELKYLNCVLNETSRKWSSALYLDRVCTKPYLLPPPREGGKPYQVNPGDMVYNLVNSIHWDPKYYQEPLVFDPERFSDQNKHKIKPFTFMPFGAGPRSCLGPRYEDLKMKVIIYHVILNFRILKTEKTQEPIKMRPDVFNIRAAGGTYLQFQARNL